MNNTSHSNATEQVAGLPPLTAEDIFSRVSTATGVPVELIKSPSRKADVYRARVLTTYMLRTRLGLSFRTIANLFNHSDHSTFVHNMDRAKDLFATEQSFRDSYDAFVTLFY